MNASETVLTAQGIFDQVVAHLRQQGKRCANANGSCLYRGPDGLKCAVGVLITDEEYRADWEGNGVFFLIRDPARKGSQSMTRYAEHADLIRSLQSVHDNDDVEDWEDQFLHIAMAYHLTLAPPNA